MILQKSGVEFGENSRSCRMERDLEEKKFGLLSKQYVKDHYPIGSTAMLRTHKDKTG